MRPRSLIAAFLLLGIISTVHAEDIDFWNFRGMLPEGTSANGLTTAEPTDEGLFVRTSTEGVVTWQNQPLDAPAEVLTMRVRSSRAVTARFIWSATDGSAEGAMYQLPFTIPVTEIPLDIDVVLSDYTTWDWRTDSFGIVFPSGTELILEEMTFRHWTPMERIIAGLKSFWTFDDFKPYSINFLWGPLIAESDPAREQLFENLPPFAWSATRIFYIVLILSAVAGAAIAYGMHKRALGLGIFVATFSLLWLLFDIRMGAEIISYAVDDLRSYVFVEKDERQLRTHTTLYAVFDDLLPDIRKHERYALFSPQGSIVYPNLRYASYPSVPVLPHQDRTDVRLFVVFGDTSIKMDEQNRLVRPSASGSGTEILSAPGTVIRRIQDSIFIFEAQQ